MHWNFLVLIGQGKILLPHPQFLCSICSICVAFHLPLGLLGKLLNIDNYSNSIKYKKNKNDNKTF